MASFLHFFCLLFQILPFSSASGPGSRLEWHAVRTVGCSRDIEHGSQGLRFDVKFRNAVCEHGRVLDIDRTAVWGQDASSWDGDSDNSVDEGLHDRTIKCAAPIQSDAEQQIRAFFLPAASPLDSSGQE